MPQELNRVALVTGASQGIGAEIARTLAGQGYSIAAHDRENTTSLARIVTELRQMSGVSAAPITGDLSRPGTIANLFSRFDQEFGSLDVVVNNAGFETISAAEDLSEQDWRAVLEVNVTAPFLIAQQAARRMNQGGVIVNISSIHDTVPRKGIAHYTAAKAALRMLSKSLALEWAGRGIRVITVAPGVIETEMNRAAIASLGREKFESWVPLARLGTTSDVANAVAFLCSDKASYITGTELVVDGGYTTNLVRYDDRPTHAKSRPASP